MNQINFEPIGRVYMTPMKKKERHIRQLEEMIKISMVLNAVLMALLIIIVYSGGVK